MNNVNRSPNPVKSEQIEAVIKILSTETKTENVFYTPCASPSGMSLGKEWLGRQEMWQLKLKIPMQEQVLCDRKSMMLSREL